MQAVRVRQRVIERTHDRLHLRECEIVEELVARRGAWAWLVAGRGIGDVNHALPKFKVQATASTPVTP